MARLSRRLRPTEAAGSLTATEVDVLVAAERRGPIRLSNLAGFAGLNPTMLSRLVPKLEEAGLVRRLADEEDRRVCRVEATARGAACSSAFAPNATMPCPGGSGSFPPPIAEPFSLALPVLEELAERLLGPEARPQAGGKSP